MTAPGERLRKQQCRSRRCRRATSAASRRERHGPWRTTEELLEQFGNGGPGAAGAKQGSVADRLAAEGALTTMYSAMAQESLLELGLSYTMMGAGIGLALLQPWRERPERQAATTRARI